MPSDPQSFGALKLTREWIAFLFACVGTAPGVYNVVVAGRSAAAAARVQADALLEDAWDIMGGEAGSSSLSKFVSDKRQIELATRKIVRAERIAPKYARAWWIHSSLAAAQGNLADALTFAQKAHALDPTSPEPLSRIGWVQVNQAKWRDAAETYRIALRLKPGDALLHSNLCYVPGRSGESRAAIAECNEAIRLDENFGQAYENLAEILQSQADWRGAAAAYQKAVHIRSADDAVLTDYCYVLLMSNDPAGALAQCNAAVALNPASERAYRLLSKVFVANGRKAEADAAEAKADQLRASATR